MFVLRELRWCAVMGMGKVLNINELREGVTAVLRGDSKKESGFMGENSMECLLRQYCFMGGTVRMTRSTVDS